MVSLRLRPKQQVPAEGPAATALPAVARPALALLLVTPDGGDAGALGRIVAATTAGPVACRAPDEVTGDDLAAAAMVVVLLPDEEAERLQAALGARPPAPVVAVPWGIFPGHLASALARTGDLAGALAEVRRERARRRYTLGIEPFFQAWHAVFLSGRLGPRHPHSWHVRARFAAEHAASGQVLIDSAAARALLAAETELLEGRYLNELAPFDQPDCQPTVENVLAVLFDRLEARAHAVGLHIEELTLWENPTSFATCRVAS